MADICAFCYPEGMSDRDQIAEHLIDSVALRVEELRRAHPEDDYAGRIYYCDHCNSFDAVAAPVDELPDGYPCPTCERPQRAVTEPGVPTPQPRPNRALRRRRPSRG